MTKRVRQRERERDESVSTKQDCLDWIKYQMMKLKSLVVIVTA